MTLARSIHGTAAQWLSDGRRVAAATLVGTDGSAPLPLGSTMLIDDHGRIEGSVTGGCVEGALVEEAQAVLSNGPPRMRTYGISDAMAIGVGLMCGGVVHVFVHEIASGDRALFEMVDGALAAKRQAAVATLLDGQRAGAMVAVVDGRLEGGFEIHDRLDRAVERDALGCLDHGVSVVRRFGSAGETMGSDLRVFIHAFAAAPEMVIFGAIDFSAAVASIAKQLGYRVTICDARTPFAESSRFSVADEVVVDWPDRYLTGRHLGERDVVLVFTHDPKFDEPALRAALETDAGYVGALGSRLTHEDRTRRLLEAGLSPSVLGRIKAPCGLDVGARTPEETAVSILAEVIACSSRRSGLPLSQTEGQIRPQERVLGELDTAAPASRG